MRNVPGVTYRPALDGLRAVAILGVLIAHARPDVFPGGAEGVTVFFVLSGFLITTLLLGERDRTGRVSLGAFYSRRAARLLPALILVLLATCAWLIHFGYDRHTIEIGAVSTLFYSSNIVMSVMGRTQLEPFAWSWSLAIEEQFYLLWPWVLRRLAHRPRLFLGVTLGAVGAVYAERWRVMHYGNGTWADMGTDTKADAILLGCALAIMLRQPQVRARFARFGGWLGPVGIVLIVFTYRWNYVSANHYYFVSIPLAELGAMMLIGAIDTRPGIVGRLLSTRPFVLIGQVSYGMYLWNLFLRGLFSAAFHRPVVFASAPVVGAWILLVFAVAWVSFRCVEQPIRDALRRWQSARTLAVTGAVINEPSFAMATPIEQSSSLGR